MPAQGLEDGKAACYIAPCIWAGLLLALLAAFGFGVQARPANRYSAAKNGLLTFHHCRLTELMYFAISQDYERIMEPEYFNCALAARVVFRN